MDRNIEFTGESSTDNRLPYRSGLRWPHRGGQKFHCLRLTENLPTQSSTYSLTPATYWSTNWKSLEPYATEQRTSFPLHMHEVFQKNRGGFPSNPSGRKHFLPRTKLQDQKLSISAAVHCSNDCHYLHVGETEQCLHEHWWASTSGHHAVVRLHRH